MSSLIRQSLISANGSRLIPAAGGTVTNVRFMGRRFPKPGKPPILPPAKKVLYKVVQPEWMKPEDVTELLWRRHAYNNAVTTLRGHFKQEIVAKEAAGLGIEALKAREKEELDALIKENERYNQSKALEREDKEKVSFDKLKAELLEDIDARLKSKDNMVKLKTKEVAAMIDQSETFITKENLDEKLMAALDAPMVHDYCIDLNGQKFYDPLPTKYLEGTPTRQKGRVYDRSLVPPRNIEYQSKQEAQSSS